MSSSNVEIENNNVLFKNVENVATNVADVATIVADLNKNDKNAETIANVANTVATTVTNVENIVAVVEKASDDVKPVDATKVDEVVKNVGEAANVVVSIENVVSSIVSNTGGYKSPISTILSICGQACAAVNNQQIDKSNVIVMVHSLMEAVETFKSIKGLSGEQKKQLVIDCLHWLVNNHCALIEFEKQELLILIDHIAPPAIDVIISVANGISQLVDKIKTKCSCCRIA